MKKEIKFIEKQGQRVIYEVWRPQKTKDLSVVMLHGLGGDRTVWREFQEYLGNKGVSSVAIDLPGHGESETGFGLEEYFLENIGKLVGEIMGKEKLGSWVGVGHCWGGMVVARLEEGEGLRGKVLINSTDEVMWGWRGWVWRKFTSDGWEQLLDKLSTKRQGGKRDYHKYRGQGDFNLKRIREDVRATSWRSWTKAMVGLALSGGGGERSIKEPMLLVAGRKDKVVKFDRVVEFWSRNKKQVKLVEIKKGGHLAVINDAEVVKKELLDFIKRL